METNLRPLTLGEILDRTAFLYRSNFILFAGISGVIALFSLAINLAFVTVRSLMSPFTWWVQVLGWISMICFLVLSNVTAAATNRAVAWVYLGEPATIGRAYKSIWPNLGRYMWLGSLKLLIAWTPVLALYGGYLAVVIYANHSGAFVAKAAGQPPSAGSMMFLAATGVFLVAIWPALIYGFFMGLRYSLALPASVVENLKARPALKRSVALTKGTRGRILVLWLLVIVLEIGAITITQGFFFIYNLKHHAHMAVSLRVLQQVVGFFTNTVLGPIIATGTTLFYYDQRVRNEGFDIEWMMAAAGLEPVTTSTVAEKVATLAAEIDPASSSGEQG